MASGLHLDKLDLRKIQKINLLLAALLVFTLASILQRAVVRRSRLAPLPVADLSADLPLDLTLEIAKIYPEAYSEDTYQLAYMVQSLRPASALAERRLINGPEGEVAVGVDPEGRLELQTCLMDSGRVAVTNERMVSEVASATSGNPGRRSELLLQGVLLGRPLSSRPCLLIQLRSEQPLRPGDGSREPMEQQLLQTFWPLLEFLQPTATQQLR
jgi:hypothetical protein